MKGHNNSISLLWILAQGKQSRHTMLEIQLWHSHVAAFKLTKCFINLEAPAAPMQLTSQGLELA